jgi:hypothetical protein
MEVTRIIYLINDQFLEKICVIIKKIQLYVKSR